MLQPETSALRRQGLLIQSFSRHLRALPTSGVSSRSRSVVSILSCWWIEMLLFFLVALVSKYMCDAWTSRYKRSLPDHIIFPLLFLNQKSILSCACLLCKHQTRPIEGIRPQTLLHTWFCLVSYYCLNDFILYFSFVFVHCKSPFPFRTSSQTYRLHNGWSRLRCSWSDLQGH